MRAGQSLGRPDSVSMRLGACDVQMCTAGWILRIPRLGSRDSDPTTRIPRLGSHDSDHMTRIT